MAALRVLWLLDSRASRSRPCQWRPLETARYVIMLASRRYSGAALLRIRPARRTCCTGHAAAGVAPGSHDLARAVPVNVFLTGVSPSGVPSLVKLSMPARDTYRCASTMIGDAAERKKYLSVCAKPPVQRVRHAEFASSMHLWLGRTGLQASLAQGGGLRVQFNPGWHR